MRIKTFEELAAADKLTLRFSPMGLGGELSPTDAAEFQQQSIASCDLAVEVDEVTRRSFERLRELHVYGVLFYDAFTIAGDLASMVAECALRERFVAFYGGEVPLIDTRSGAKLPLEASNYQDVDQAFRKGGSHQKGRWQIHVDPSVDVDFRGSMPDLLRWARAAGLLPGQRSRPYDALWVGIRNSVAHPRFHRYGPIESTMAIRDLAELINQLWGHPTQGGRLFPADLERSILLIAWNSNAVSIFRPDQLAQLEDAGAWTCICVRAVPDDPHIWEFDASVERTHYPAELLLGPVAPQEALSWLRSADPAPDTVSHLNRLFVVKVDAGSAGGPWQPEVALGLLHEERDGQWFLVRADHPSDAYAFGCALAEREAWEPSHRTIADLATHGSTPIVTPIASFEHWDALETCLTDDFEIMQRLRPPAVRVPSIWSLGQGPRT